MMRSDTAPTLISSTRRSTWFSVPLYLHRASVPVLIGLTVIQLHSPPETRSLCLAGAFFSMALLGIVLERTTTVCPRAHHSTATTTTTTTTSSPTNPYACRGGGICAGAGGGVDGTARSTRLAISLVRATLYAFIADIAAAQLLFLNNPSSFPSPSSSLANGGSEREAVGPLVLTSANLAQLVLAGCMWLLGALLWIMEPTLYWISASSKSRNASACGERGRARVTQTDWQEKSNNGYFLLLQEDSDVEQDAVGGRIV